MAFTFSITTRFLPSGEPGFLVIGREGEEIVEMVEDAAAVTAISILQMIRPEFKGAEIIEGIEFVNAEEMDLHHIVHLAEDDITIMISAWEAGEFYRNGTHHEGLRLSDSIRIF